MPSDRPHSRAESPQRIEPARLDNPPERVSDLVGVVRIMNSYYSNLIEGHNTRPRDIERALAGDLDHDEARRHLQLEAAAHVRVQSEVDRMAAAGTLTEPAAPAFIQWLHREFYRDAPEAMLRVSGTDRELTMTPGEWRSRVQADDGPRRYTTTERRGWTRQFV